MNEETIIQNRPAMAGQNESKKEGGAWKHVTLGGVSGILVGAGAMYAGNALANNAETASEESADSITGDGQLPVAEVSDDLSFSEAFAAARAEVGPGGVFYWHGGIYGTYYAEEWNAMTDEQKHEFAQRVQPEITPEHVTVPTDAHPDVAVHHVDANVHQVSNETQEVSSDVSEVTDDIDLSGFEVDSDVHIVGVADADGHLVVGYDLDADGGADVALIDIDDTGNISEPDIIMDTDGNMATVGDVMESEVPNMESDPVMSASMESSDIDPEMPDYMNEGNVEDMAMPV